MGLWKPFTANGVKRRRICHKGKAGLSVRPQRADNIFRICGRFVPQYCELLIRRGVTMSFFISDAMAENGAAASGSGFEALIPLILLFVVFYFLLIRPQQKKVKEHKKLVEALSKGAEVVTYGGLAGKIRELDESFIDLEIAPNVTVKVERQNVARELPKGTLKGQAE
jgi:preprotein translocase subunit YajC